VVISAQRFVSVLVGLLTKYNIQHGKFVFISTNFALVATIIFLKSVRVAEVLANEMQKFINVKY